MTATLLRAVITIAVLLGGVGVLLVAGRRSPPESNSEQDGDTPPLVATERVEQHATGLDITTDGIVVPYREITLAAQVSGTVQYKSPDCNEGTFVVAGTKLLQIDPRDYQLEVRRLEGELQQATANLKELSVELENAQQKVPLAERDVKLLQQQQARVVALRARNVVSEDDVNDAERNVIAARNALLEATRQRDALQTRKASLESAIVIVQVRLEQAQLNLDRTTIVAPVTGVIIQDNVEKDSYAQTGAQLLVMEDTEKVEVRCNLRMEEMRWIWQQASPAAATSELASTALDAASSPVASGYHSLPPSPVTVRYELGGRTYEWNGKLDRYDGLGLDERTRMVPCRIVVDDPRSVSVDGVPATTRGPRSLVRGMYVGLVIHTRPDVPLLRVPEKAIQPGNVVWRVEGGQLERVELRLAESLDEVAIVDAEASGLAVGDRLVVSPLQAAYSGLEVQEETAE